MAKELRITEDVADFLFRSLFCLIFVGLGAEHIVSDALIQKLMPAWVPFPRLVSLACGIWLFGWGLLIFLGWKVQWAARALGVFLIAVTIIVHAPGVVTYPEGLGGDCLWMWDILQRTNLVKNICLLGVCFHLLHHDVGRYSVEHFLQHHQRN